MSPRSTRAKVDSIPFATSERGRIRERSEGSAEEGTPRSEFAPEVAKLILGASLYDRSNGPKQSTTAADALNTILSDIRPLPLPATCVGHSVLGAQLLCKDLTAPGTAALQ